MPRATKKKDVKDECTRGIHKQNCPCYAYDKDDVCCEYNLCRVHGCQQAYEIDKDDCRCPLPKGMKKKTKAGTTTVSVNVSMDAISEALASENKKLGGRVKYLDGRVKNLLIIQQEQAKKINAYEKIVELIKETENLYH